MKKSIHTKEYQVFLKLLIEQRLKAGLTQAQLGERLTFGQPGISKIERAERRVDIVELKMICEQLSVNIEDFISQFKTRLANDAE